MLFDVYFFILLYTKNLKRVKNKKINIDRLISMM